METTNSTSTCDYNNLSIFVIAGVIVLSLTLVFVSVLVVVIIWRNPSLHNNSNILVASLAISDILLASVFVCVLDEALPKSHSNIPKGKIVGGFVLGGCCGSTAISILLMGAIAIDRYVNIVHPFYYISKMTKRRTFITIILIWMIGIVMVIIPTAIVIDDKQPGYCIIFNPPFYYFCAVTVIYIGMFILICVSYFRIAQVSLKHNQAANSRRIRANAGAVPSKTNRAAAMRSVKFFALMFGLFSVFTLPPVTLTGVNYLYPIRNDVRIAVTFLLAFNSLSSCSVYIYMNRSFFPALQRTMVNSQRLCCSFRN